MSRKVLSPKFRVSFPNVFEPQENNGKKSYGLTMLFEKEAYSDGSLDDIKAIIKEAVKEKYGSKKPPSNFRGNPFRDADKEGKTYDGYQGMVFAACKSKQRPGVVDQSLNDIIDSSEFYAGCYARATLTAYCYEFSGNCGVALGLQNIQKMGEGEPFAGRTNAADDFDSLDESESEETEAATVDDDDLLGDL